jgi:hypothetical protein
MFNILQALLDAMGHLANHNANFCLTGPQKPRGAPRKYTGKVKFDDLNASAHVGPLEDDAELYTAVVWHRSLKRQIRMALIVNT